MPLSATTFTSHLSYGETKTNTGFAPTSAAGGINFNLSDVDVSVVNQLYASTITLAAAASTTLDLTSLSNLVAEAFAFGHLVSILIKVAGAACTLAPGATNPNTLFLGGATQSVVIPVGGSIGFSYPASASGKTVSSTAKTLTITNSGGVSATVNLVILGSTT